MTRSSDHPDHPTYLPDQEEPVPPAHRPGRRWHLARSFGRGTPASFALATVGLFAALSLLAFWPFHRLWRSHLYTWPGDALFNLWVIEWVGNHLGRGWSAVWDAAIFFPVEGALALSDHLIAPAVASAGLRTLLEAPVARFNLLVLASFATAGAATVWLARQAGLGRTAALFAGLAFAFSPYRFDHLDHPQLLWVACWPLALLALDRLLGRPSPAWGWLFAAAYAGQLFAGMYLALMGHVFLLAVFLAHLPALWRRRQTWLALVRCGWPALLPPALFAWQVVPQYQATAQRLGAVRGEADVWAWGAMARSFLDAGARNVWPGLWSRLAGESLAAPRPENALFAGLLPSLAVLAAVCCVLLRLRHRPRRDRVLAALAVVLAVLAVVAGDRRTALGPGDGTLGTLGALAAGSLAVALALAAWVSRRSWWGDAAADAASSAPRLRWALGAATVLSLALAFPWFYELFRGWVPGLEGMRVTARFYAMASLGLAIAAGWGLESLFGRRRGVLVAALVLAALELRPTRIHWTRLPSPGELSAHQWLAVADRPREGQTPAPGQELAPPGRIAAIVEVPIKDDTTEIRRMYDALAHRRPLFNGYSGYFPAHYSALRPRLSGLPEPAVIDELGRLGVTHLVVHNNLLWGPREVVRRASWKRTNVRSRQARLELVWRGGPSEVYRILPPRAGAEPADPSRQRPPRPAAAPPGGPAVD
jgi:hypothetical protein